MLEYLFDIWENLLSVFRLISIVDVLDILLLSWLIYKGIKLVHETRAEQLIKGLIILAALFFIVNQFDLKAMKVIIETFFNVGIIALLIVFQPELRRVLEKMGRTKVKNIAFNFDSITDEYINNMNLCINAICNSCEQLSQSTTGALIVIERETKLGEQIDTGTILNAVPSSEMFGNIFFPNSPLHDGAVIVREGMIYAAGCFLPKPQKEELISKALGSRHRAAIGISEISDAIIVIVSEETGTISVAENGTLDRFFSKESLRKRLNLRLLPQIDVKKEKKPKKKKKKKPENGSGRALDK